jgi:acetyl-CoA synthetase
MTNHAVWEPSQTYIESTRLFQWMKQLSFSDYEKFLQASVDDTEWFWHEVEAELGIEWIRPYEQVLDQSKGIKYPNWYVDGQINIIQSVLDKWTKDPVTADQLALVWEGEDGEVKK